VRVESSAASLKHLSPLIRPFTLERTTGLEPATLTLATRTCLPLSTAQTHIGPDQKVFLVQPRLLSYGPYPVDWARDGHADAKYCALSRVGNCSRLGARPLPYRNPITIAAGSCRAERLSQPHQ
jgi:hypothetical protein